MLCFFFLFFFSCRHWVVLISHNTCSLFVRSRDESGASATALQTGGSATGQLRSILRFRLSETPLCVSANRVTADLNYSSGAAAFRPLLREKSKMKEIDGLETPKLLFHVYIYDSEAFMALENF